MSSQPDLAGLVWDPCVCIARASVGCPASWLCCFCSCSWQRRPVPAPQNCRRCATRPRWQRCPAATATCRVAWTPNSHSCARSIASKASRPSAPPVWAAGPPGRCCWRSSIAGERHWPTCRLRARIRVHHPAQRRRDHHQSPCRCSSCASSEAVTCAAAPWGAAALRKPLALAIEDATWNSHDCVCSWPDFCWVCRWQAAPD